MTNELTKKISCHFIQFLGRIILTSYHLIQLFNHAANKNRQILKHMQFMHHVGHQVKQELSVRSDSKIKPKAPHINSTSDDTITWYMLAVLAALIASCWKRK
jgi:hypothetical protein